MHLVVHLLLICMRLVQGSSGHLPFVLGQGQGRQHLVCQRDEGPAGLLYQL